MRFVKSTQLIIELTGLKVTLGYDKKSFDVSNSYEGDSKNHGEKVIQDLDRVLMHFR